MAKRKRKCTTATCEFRNIEVDTERKDCLGCKKMMDIADPLGDLLGDIFGGGPLGGGFAR